MSTLAEIALEEDLPGHSCTVCFEKFCASDVIHVPRILRCGHTFCTNCCHQLLKSGTITCPKCSCSTRCEAGVDQLVKNFGVLEIVESAPPTSPQLMRPLATTSSSDIGTATAAGPRRGSIPSDYADSGPEDGSRQRCHSCSNQRCPLVACGMCHALLCSACNVAVHRIPGFRDHQISHIDGLSAAQINRLLRPPDASLANSHVQPFASASSPDDPRLYCSEHEKEKKKIFCRTCNELICIYCQMHGSHQHHTCVMARDHVLSERVRLDRLGTAIHQRRQQWLQAFDGVMDTTEAIRHSSSRLEDDLQEHFRSLRHCLELRESALRQVLRVFIDERLEILHEQSCELTSLSRQAKDLEQSALDVLQQDAASLLIESPRLSQEIQNLLLLKTPLYAQARDDIVFRWPRLAMAEASVQHFLDDSLDISNPMSLAAGGGASSAYEVNPSAADGDRIESRSLSDLITHHGEMMILPPAVSPCHCTPYLHCIRIFWSAVDMPDLPLLEYRVEHIYWVASSSGGSSTAAVASVDDGLTGAVGNGLPSPSSAPGSSAARVNGYASPNSQGDVPIPGNPTSPPMVADVNSPQSASATSSPPTLLKAPTTGGVAGIKSRSLPRGSLMESVHAGAERVPNVAYVKDHFSGEESMEEAEAEDDEEDNDDVDDVDDLNEADSNVLFDMRRCRSHVLSTPGGSASGVTVEPLHVKSPPSHSPGPLKRQTVSTSAAVHPVKMLARGHSAPVVPSTGDVSRLLMFNDDVFPAANDATVGLETRPLRVASDPVQPPSSSGGSPSRNFVAETLPSQQQLQSRVTASLPVPRNLALAPALPMPRSISAPTGSKLQQQVSSESHTQRQERRSVDDEAEVDATTEMMTVVVCDQGTPRVVKTPVSAAPMELTMSAVAEFTAVQGGLQLACASSHSTLTSLQSARTPMQTPNAFIQSPATFRKSTAASSTISAANVTGWTSEQPASVSSTTVTCAGSPPAARDEDEKPGKREMRRVVYRGKSRSFDLQHSFKPNSEHGFRVSVCSRAGLGPWSPITRIAIPGPAFSWNSRASHRSVHISDDNLTATIDSNRFWVTVGADTVLDKGCHYWECVLKQYGETSRNWKVVIGVVAASVAPSVWKRDKVTIGIARHGMTAPSWGYITAQGKKVSSVSTSSWGTDYTTGASHGRCVEGDTVGVLLDLDLGTLEFYQNGNSLGIAFDHVNVPVIPAISFYHHKAVELRFAPPPLL